MPTLLAPESRKSNSTRELNVRLLVVSLVLVAVVGTALYFWHDHKVSQLATAFLERAESAEQEGDLEAASRYLFRYLQIDKTSEESNAAVVRLAKTIDKNATSGAQKMSAIRWYFRALGITDDQLALRIRLSELLLDTGQFTLAEEQSQLAVEQAPDDFTAKRVLALSRFGLFLEGRPVSIDELTADLVDLNQTSPNDIKVAKTLAHIYRELNVPINETRLGITADRIINRLVDAEPANYEVYLARHLYRKRYQLPGADGDIEKATELAPDEARIVQAAAQSAFDAGKFNDSLEHFQKLTRIEPKQTSAYLGIGASLLSQGQTDLAIQAWTDGLAKTEPNDLAINVRLADTLIDLERTEEAKAAMARIDVAISQLTSQGRESIRDWSVAAKALLEAKLAIVEQRFSQAIPLLREVATTSKPQLRESEDVELAFKAWLLLGHTNWQLHQWEDAAVSYERALEVLPSSNSTRVLASKAWAASGRLEKALVLADQAASRVDASEQSLVTLAKLYLQRELLQPATQRDWTQFRRVLSSVDDVLPDSWELPFIRVKYFLATNPRAAVSRSLELLLEGEQAHADNERFWAQAVLAYQMLGLESEADRALERLDTLTNSSPMALMVRAEMLAGRNQFDAAERTLRTIQTQNSDDRRLIIDAIIRILIGKGNSEQLEQFLVSQLQANPNDTNVLGQLAEAAVRQSDDEKLQKWVAELRNVEGEKGSLWRFFEARRQLMDSHDASIEAIWTLHEQVDQLRPWWAGGTFLKALLSEKEGKADDAISSYKAALEQGLRTAEVFNRLIDLLQKSGRITDAEQYAQLMRASNPHSQSVSGISISSAVQQGQVKLALEMAERNIRLNPKDAEAHVWMARSLLVNGEAAKAIEHLDVATQLEPNNLLVFTSRFLHFAHTNQRELAEQVLAEIESNHQIREIPKHLMLAQSYQMLGNAPKTDAFYNKVLERDPENVDVLMRYAMFLADIDLNKAEEFARTAMKIAPTNPAARRTLAVILGSKDDIISQRRAGNLLELSTAEDKSADQRLNAILLLRRGGNEDLAEAEKILRELVSERGHSNIDDNQLLAAILEHRGDIDGATAEYETILASEFATSRHTASYVSMLLRAKQIEKANVLLVKLEEQAPNSLLTVRLRAEWLLAQGMIQRVGRYVETFAAKQIPQFEEAQDRMHFQLRIARLFERLRQPNLAEAWYRKTSDQFPSAKEQLVLHLAKNKKVNAAETLCVDLLSKQQSPSVAVALARVLMMQPSSGELKVRQETLLSDAMKQFPNDANLLFYVANLRLTQGRQDDAIALYKRLTEYHPNHILGWNNLAALLADDEDKVDEALSCIDRAIEHAGYNIPILLDTKATVLLGLGEAEKAVEILSAVVAMPNGNDPRFHFHLSVALNTVGDAEESKRAFDRAAELGLNQSFLTQAERQVFREFESRKKVDNQQ